MSLRKPSHLGGEIPVAHVIGGGVMGLIAAIELSHLSGRLGIDLGVRVYEKEAFCGGFDDRSSAPRSQAWLHTDGQLYAQTQPTVCLSLQRSTRRLRRLAPEAIRYPPAFSIEIASGTSARAAAAYNALGVPHWACSREDVRRWFPGLHVPSDANLYRVRDATIDLRLLGGLLAQHAKRLGVRLLLQGVHRLGLRRGRVQHVICDGGERALLGACDFVVLACGARIRPLLSAAGLTIAGLRVFRSHLICSDSPQIPALVTVLGGGLTLVPHRGDDGSLLNIFGNSARVELPPSEDGKPVGADRRAVEELRLEAEGWFRTAVPAGPLMSWAGVKTEIVRDGLRSQSSHALRVSDLENCWAAVPGKLSQAPACALDLSRQILRGQLQGVARSIWEVHPDVSTGAFAAAY